MRWNALELVSYSTEIDVNLNIREGRH